jgi:uncharacterized damage-inducible protein DinB
MRTWLATLFCVALAAPLAAEDNIVPKLVERWKTSKAYTVAVAEAMPEDGYSFKPNPAQMSFGEQLDHLASSNAYFVALVAGKKPPLGDLKQFDKTTVVKRINEAFDYSIATLGSVTPEQLNKVIKTPDGTMTGLEALLLALDHTSNHRGQAIVYLRARNQKPPEYRF